MKKTGILFLYIASVLVFLGGLGDQFIFNFLDVHLNYMGNPENSEWFEKAEELAMLMLHSAGGGLMGVGIGMFSLTHFAIRQDQQWALRVYIIIAFVAEGINGYGMYVAHSHFWYPLLALILVVTGGILTYPAMGGHKGSRY